MLLITSPPITSYVLEPLAFFDARSEGLRYITTGEDKRPHAMAVNNDIQRDIVRFVRTPNGEGLGVLRTDGSVETWTISSNGRGELCRSLQPNDKETVDQIVVLECKQVNNI